MHDRNGLGPDRFFSIRTDDLLRGILERVGVIAEFATWPGEHAWHYQWVVLRTPQPPV